MIEASVARTRARYAALRSTWEDCSRLHPIRRHRAWRAQEQAWREYRTAFNTTVLSRWESAR